MLALKIVAGIAIYILLVYALIAIASTNGKDLGE